MSDLVLVRVRIPLQESLPRNEKSRCANAALESGMLEEFLLQGVQPLRCRQTLHGGDLLTFDLGSQDEAGIDENAVNYNRTSTAVAVVAPLFGPRKPQFFPKDFQQALAGFTEEIQLLSIYCRFNMYPLCHLSPCSQIYFYIAIRRD